VSSGREGSARAYENAPIEHLRIAVADCHEQEEFYRLCGFEDISVQEPTKAAWSMPAAATGH
jgi:catechol-2,3-dioxygenase